MAIGFPVVLVIILLIEIKMKGHQWPGVILGGMLVASLGPDSPILDLLVNMNSAAESALASIFQGIGEML